MNEVYAIFEKNQVVNEQLRLLEERISATDKGYVEAVRVGARQVSRSLLDFESALNKERDEHRKQVERLKNKIAKLEQQKQ